MPSISFKGDKSIVNALSVIGRQRNQKIGELVLEAILHTYGSEIDAVNGSFFTQSGTPVNKTAGHAQVKRLDKTAP